MELVRVLYLLVAVVCILSIGAVSSTLSDSVDTDPSDIIDTSFIPTQNNPIGSAGGGGGGAEIGGDEESGVEQKQGNPEERKETQGETEPQEGNKGGGTDQQGSNRTQDYLLSLAILIGTIIALYIGYKKELYKKLLVQPKEVRKIDFGQNNYLNMAYIELLSQLDEDYSEISSYTLDEIREKAEEENLNMDAVDQILSTIEEIEYSDKELTKEYESNVVESLEKLRLA